MSAEKTPQPEPSENRADPQKDVETVVAARAQSEFASDVVLASETGAAPSFRPPAPPAAPAARAKARDDRPMALLPGAVVDDFEIVRMLGRGAFGHVYLARQVSLDRLVALKVSANRGSEGRTMARLEHQHIVQVFTEKVDADFNQRLLCMQLVPGIGLEKLIGALHARPPRSDGTPYEWTGRELLAIIDSAAPMPTALDPSALHDREALGRMDAVEATAWFGSRLAEALDFAHRHGVLHRDIKPANILVNPYGRPLLADFNISSQPVGSAAEGDEMFGGTFAYMAPEHLDAFNPAEKDVGPEAVTGQSDLYSLGLVLRQLLEGRLGLALPHRKGDMTATLREMAKDRRAARPACTPGPPSARKTLERTLHRCLAPEAGQRFASGAELGEQLDGCRRLSQAERHLPPPARFWARTLRRPFLWLTLLVVLPQVLASVINIAYNRTQIVGPADAPPTGSQHSFLNPDQKKLFVPLVIGYNAIVYPVAISLFVIALRPVWRCWRKLAAGKSLPDDEVDTARRKALRLPSTIAALVALGWFPGGILFPLAIHLAAPPLPLAAWAHFFVSFFMSGLIALAYSLCGAQFVVLRALYPGMWCDVRSFHELAQNELAPMTVRFKYIQFLAGSIPLLAAILTLGLVGDPSNSSFKWLVAGMIVLGWIGFQVASAVIRDLSQVVVALTSTKA